MTRLCNPPLEIQVELGPEGAPGRAGGPLNGRLVPLSRWRVEVDWWDAPVAREYWKVLLHDQLLCEVFHDLDTHAWYLERIYD
jgi:hypothetical protein